MPDLYRASRRLRNIFKMSATITFLIVSLVMFFSHSVYFGVWHQREQPVICLGDDIDAFGELDPARKYAIFSTTSMWTPESIGHVFQLPLTVLAWKRIGYDSVVIIVGSADVWNSDSLLYHVFSSVRKLGAVVVFVKAEPAEQIKISQISRIFAGSILRQLHAVGGNSGSSIDDVHLVTSDADLWPITASVYDAPVDADVLSLNAFCCGSFSFNGTSYRMLPISNIAMRIRSWTEITNRERSPICSSQDIADLSTRTLGDLVARPICEFEPENGNESSSSGRLDQRLVSVLLKTFTDRHGEQRMKTVKRETSSDRIVPGAGRWDNEAGLVGKIDARLPLDAYDPAVWSSRVLPLARALYGASSDSVAWATSYQQKFWRLLQEAGKETFSTHSRIKCPS